MCVIFLIYICDSSAVSGYIEAVRELACELLDLMAEGLGVPDTSLFSRLITDADSDSILRLNHYPPMPILCKDKDTSPTLTQKAVGSGETGNQTPLFKEICRPPTSLDLKRVKI